MKKQKSEIDQLKGLIKEEADKLTCVTHDELCNLRDRAYQKFEQMVIRKIFQNDEPVSVNTALAELQTELAHAGSDMEEE